MRRERLRRAPVASLSSSYGRTRAAGVRRQTKICKCVFADGVVVVMMIDSRIPSGSRLIPVARHINSLALTQSSQGVQPSELLHLVEQVVAVNPRRGLRVGCGLHRRRKGRPLGRGGGGGEQKEATDLPAIRLPARGHGGSG